MLLLMVLLLGGAAPTPPKSYEEIWRKERLASEQEDLRVVEQRVDDALRRAGEDNQERGVWALRILRAELYLQQNRVEDAKKIFERKLPAALQKSDVAARRLMYLALMRANSSIDDYKRYLAQAKAIATAHAPEVLPEIAVASRDQAEILRAIEIARKARNERGAAKAEAQLSWLYQQQQRFSEGIQLGEAVLPRLEALGYRRTVKTVAGNLGWAYFTLGDYETAEDYVVRAEAEARKTNAVAERLRWMDWLGNLKFVRRDWAGAEKHYKEVYVLARNTSHPEFAHVLMYLARVAVETGRYDDARRYVADASRIEQTNNDVEDVHNARVVGAWVDVRTGRYREAEATLKEVLAKSKSTAVRSEARVRLAQLYVRVGNKPEAEKSFREVIDGAKKAREEVSQELQFSLFNAINDTFDEYVDFLVRDGRVEDALDVTETSRAQMLEERLEKEKKARLAPTAVAKSTGATILCYWLGRNRSYVWTVTPQRVTLAPLAAEPVIEQEVDRYRKDLLDEDTTFNETRARGTQLYAMLVPQAVRGLAGGARVVIVPDGRLHTLNFETLVSRNRYWIHDVTIATAPSLQLLARRETRKVTNPTMLLIGNPPTVTPTFPALPRAGVEMDAVAGQFVAHCRKLNGPNATPSSYRDAAPEKFDFIHFVAHGTASRKRPLDAAVILGRDRDGAKGYTLVARDIIQHPLKARLVTISSCHGAGTREYAGEGLVGLAWAFLHAGAQQVIAALWEVNDDATPTLMKDMYARIRAGRDPAAALREAKLNLIGSGTVFSRAQYWAPFVVYDGS